MKYLFLICGFLTACGKKTADTAASDEPEDSGVVDVVVQPEDQPEEDTVSLSGVVLWSDGSPADGATIQVCAALCRRTEAGADGSFGVEGLEKEKYILLGFSTSEPSIATTVTLIDMQEDRALEPMKLHSYATSEAWGAAEQEYALDAGLTLSFTGDDMSMGLYAVTTTSNISSVQMDAADLPIDFSGGEIIGIWMLGEFDYTTSDGIAWSIRDLPENLGLQNDDSVEAFVLDNGAHAWSSLGTYTVNEGMIVGEENLLSLSTLILAAPQ